MAYYKPEEIEQMRKTFTEAKNNPNDSRSQEIFKRINEGKMNFELKALGLQPVEVPRPKIDLQAAMQSVQQVPAEEVSSMVPEQSRFVKQVTGAASDIGEDIRQAGTNIKEGFQRRTQTLGEDINRRAEGGTNLRESIGTGLGFASATLRTAFDVLGEGGMLAIKAAMTPEQEAAVAEKFQQGIAAGLEATEGTAARDKVEQMVAAYNVWAEENPEEAANVRDVSGIMLSLGEAAGLKVGSTAAREAADIAADTVTTAARATGEAAAIAGRQIDEGLQTAARTAGEAIDTYSQKRRETRLANQEAKITSAVEDILRAGDDEKAVEAGRRVLSTIDVSDTPTYKELQTKTSERLGILANKQNELLSQYDNRFTLDDLTKVTDVDGTEVSQNFVQTATAQLVDYFDAIDDPVKAAKYRGLSKKMENEGLTISELNQIAKDHGQELTGFNAAGELASGLNKQSYENARRGVKETLRNKLEEVADKKTRQQSEALDKAMSDIYTVRPLIDKMTEMVARQRQRTQKPTVRERLQKNGLKLADVLTLGSVQRLAPRAMEGMRINESLNYLESENLLKRRLKELEKIEEIESDTKYADTLVDYYKNMQPGMSIRSTVRPDLVAGKIDQEDFRNITRIIDNPDARIQYEDMIKDMGLGNATNDELVSFLKEVVDEYEGVAGRPVNESFNQGATPATTTLDPKNFKTAEEYVKAYGDEAFHGSPVGQIDQFKIGEKNLTKSEIDRSGAIFFSNTESMARPYTGQLKSDLKGKGGITNARIDTKNFTKAGASTEVDAGYIKQAKDLGYDGIIWNRGAGYKVNGKWQPVKAGETPEIEYVVFNPNVIKTRTQLEDIWKQANE